MSDTVQCANATKPRGESLTERLSLFLFPRTPGIQFLWTSSLNFPKSRQGNTSILVFVDRLSKMTHFAATKDTCTAMEVADLYEDKVIKLHGKPKELISDRDTRFTSSFWQELQRHLGTQVCMSSCISSPVRWTNRAHECGPGRHVEALH